MLWKKKPEIDLGKIREWGLSECLEPFFFINISVHFPLSSMSLQAISTLFLSPQRLWAWPTLLPLLTDYLVRAALLGEGLTSWVIFIPVDCNIITAYILCQRMAPELTKRRNYLKGKRLDLKMPLKVHYLKWRKFKVNKWQKYTHLEGGLQNNIIHTVSSFIITKRKLYKKAVLSQLR